MKEEIKIMGDFVGKIVQIYPGDTYKKYGKVININDHGVLFLITKADSGATGYEVGSYRFISYSAKLSFKY